MGTTVRDAALDVMRRYGLTTIFANPGSTEVPFLAGLPGEFCFILGLHEAAVVGTATGYAIASGRPAMVLRHTTAGYGNAVNAIATARVNRAPLVVLVGQQDRRHLRHDPFLAGQLDGLAGDYPVWQAQPPRAQDVPSYLARAWHEAQVAQGPAVVVVPMDDWDAPAEADGDLAAPRALRPGRLASGQDVAALADLLGSASRPCLVAGAGNDTPAGWQALVDLADHLECPVWQEPFGARAGFPQDHPRFAGHLPAGREALRAALVGHDVVLAVGAPVFRQYPYQTGSFTTSATRVALITEHPDEACRASVELAVLADPADTVVRVCRQLTDRTQNAGASARSGGPVPRPSASEVPHTGNLDPRTVFAELASRLPVDAVVVEESPSSRADLHELIPARAPLGFVSAAMGGLGFGLPAAVGLRLALPGRGVVAVLGDGSSLYAVQGLWTAWRYRIGALFVVLANGRYAIMDRLNAAATNAPPPWPDFADVNVSAIARGFGCPAERVDTLPALREALDRIVPDLAKLKAPVVLEVALSTTPKESA